MKVRHGFAAKQKTRRLEIEKAGDKLDAYRTRRLPSFKISSLVSQPLNTIDTTFKKGVVGIYPGNVPVPLQDTIIKSSTNPTALLLEHVTPQRSDTCTPGVCDLLKK